MDPTALAYTRTYYRVAGKRVTEEEVMREAERVARWLDQRERAAEAIRAPEPPPAPRR